MGLKPEWLLAPGPPANCRANVPRKSHLPLFVSTFLLLSTLPTLKQGSGVGTMNHISGSHFLVCHHLLLWSWARYFPSGPLVSSMENEGFQLAQWFPPIWPQVSPFIFPSSVNNNHVSNDKEFVGVALGYNKFLLGVMPELDDRDARVDCT